MATELLALRELYQSVIVDHNKSPKNYRSMSDASCHAEGFNPLCGDRVTVFVKMLGDVIQDVSFEGAGCAIATASASLMTEALMGKSRADAEKLFTQFHALITESDSTTITPESLGKLTVLAGVREYPMRVKCATLAWHALHAALNGTQVVSTE